MANVLELRQLSDDKLAEMLEDRREEMFNLRFQRASGRLEDYTRLRQVRRDIARMETLLHARALAQETAAAQPEVAAALAGKEWTATAEFDYEESAWVVEFADDNGGNLARALVDLNRKQPQGRKERENKGQRSLIKSYVIAG